MATLVRPAADTCRRIRWRIGLINRQLILFCRMTVPGFMRIRKGLWLRRVASADSVLLWARPDGRHRRGGDGVTPGAGYIVQNVDDQRSGRAHLVVQTLSRISGSAESESAR